ncbi:uncharacterized protein NDAI_0D01070 [Naumovozyma dairenensis CBS 421]|uniref:Vacuolar membrane protein n=1 Tax=Naumovozyma dairenensis (strain ATCC 10597 / BCRC 20456 / CBS 421 / NBRC 0211 / NRRL Y-12639) TaxID=1071378 RepID=G0W9F9_NAUDC|nr:hypothetical protein NDAI_0D01070 [Naumovozyma dairenensis CBS 421]CCD24420.1 hypothetical protein NDAI_0D01070 [Naumovozyma dairenensis CBS 421]
MSLVQNLHVRALPKLVTTTATTTSSTGKPTTTSSFSKATTTSAKTIGLLSSTIKLPSLPSLTTTSDPTSSSSSSSATTTVTTTPIILPPSSEGNPYITGRDTRLDGTVFIAVGAIIGAIFLTMIVWRLLATIKSNKNARYDRYDLGNRNLFNDIYHISDDRENNTYRYPSSSTDNDVEEKVTNSELAHGKENFKKSTLSLLLSSRSNSNDDQEENHDLEAFIYDKGEDHDTDNFHSKIQTRYNPIHHEPTFNINRKSLFISPTLEILQPNNNEELHQPSNNNARAFLGVSTNPFNDHNYSNTSLISDSDLDDSNNYSLRQPQRAASPERKMKKSPIREGYHKRNKSSLGMISTTTLLSSPSYHNNQSNHQNNNNNNEQLIDEVVPASLESTPTKKNGRHQKTPSTYLDDLLKGE